MEACRPAQASDVARIAELAAEAQGELRGQRGGAVWAAVEARPDVGSDAIAAELDQPGVQGFVGSLDGVVVGYAIVGEETLRDGSLLAVLSDVYVEPEARELGVGELLLEAAIAWAEARGCRGIDAMALPGMRASKNLFERFGLKARRLVVHRPLGAWAQVDQSAAEEDASSAPPGGPGRD